MLDGWLFKIIIIIINHPLLRVRGPVERWPVRLRYKTSNLELSDFQSVIMITQFTPTRQRKNYLWFLFRPISVELIKVNVKIFYRNWLFCIIRVYPLQEVSRLFPVYTYIFIYSVEGELRRDRSWAWRFCTTQLVGVVLLYCWYTHGECWIGFGLCRRKWKNAWDSKVSKGTPTDSSMEIWKIWQVWHKMLNLNQSVCRMISS